jgi:uncharacterized protein (TIRG00374 family)
MISEADIKFPDIPFKKTAALILAGLLLYLGYLYLVGFESLKEALLGTDYSLLLLSAGVALIANMFHTAGWWVFLRDMKYKISFFRAYEIYLSSIFFVNVIPTAAVSGEIAKIYFVQRSVPGSRFDRTLAAGLMSRILEIIPISLGAIVGVLYVALYYHIPGWALAFCIVIAVALAAAAVIILAVAMNNDLLRRLTARLIGVLDRIFKNNKLRDRAERYDQIILQFGGSLKQLTDKKLLVVLSLALIFIAWCFDVSVAYIAFMAIGNPVSPGFVITVFSIMVILQLLPTFLPGGIGLVDIIMTSLYLAMGIPKVAAAGATIMVRLVTLWFLTSVGGLVTVYLLRGTKNTHK